MNSAQWICYQLWRWFKLFLLGCLLFWLYGIYYFSRDDPKNYIQHPENKVQIDLSHPFDKPVSPMDSTTIKKLEPVGDAGTDVVPAPSADEAKPSPIIEEDAK